MVEKPLDRCNLQAHPVAIIELPDRERTSGFQNPTPGNEAGKTPRGVRTSRKPKDEDVIFVVVVLHQPLIRLQQNVVYPDAEHSAAHLAACLSPQAGIVID